MNLPQQLQESLNYPALQLIDANTGLPQDETQFNVFSQSVLITFLVGLYKGTRSSENAAAVMKITDTQGLLDTLFTNEDELQIIATFVKQPISAVKEKITEVANGYLALVKKEAAAETEKENYLQNLMTGQRHEILRFLPTGLKLGDLLNDGSLNDDTNKMEGPISSLMHKIENAFSKTD